MEELLFLSFTHSFIQVNHRGRKKEMKMNILVAVTLGLILLNLTSCHAALTVGFYKGKCGTQDVEAIVRSVVTQRFQKDRTIIAALLRLQFHDCFVQGCDASILIDGSSSEKTAGPNGSVRGFELIDVIKTAVEKACRGIVSCADIIALATRDAVVLSGGSKASYALPTGRRDSTVSSASNVQDLPGPTISVTQAVALFKKKGLTASDMVTLLGGHTVGITHCSFITDRLYNFRNTGRQDPTMDRGLVTVLRRRCPQVSNNDNSVNLDQNSTSSFTVDNSFYKQIKLNKGVLEIDQRLASDGLSRNTVTSLATGPSFNAQFGAAMIKLCGIQVLTGTQGQIRRSCRAVNN